MHWIVSGKDENGDHIYLREDEAGNQTLVPDEEIEAILAEHGTISQYEESLLAD